MTRGVLIALGVAVAVLGAIALYMTRRDGTEGLRGGVPYYTPGAPNNGGPPLPAGNKLSSFLQQVTGTAQAASGAVDALGDLWGKTGKSWGGSGDSLGDLSAEDIDNLVVS